MEFILEENKDEDIELEAGRGTKEGGGRMPGFDGMGAEAGGDRLVPAEKEIGSTRIEGNEEVEEINDDVTEGTRGTE